MAATSAIRSFGFESMADTKTDQKSRVRSHEPSAHSHELSGRHSVIRAVPVVKNPALACK